MAAQKYNGFTEKRCSAKGCNKLIVTINPEGWFYKIRNPKTNQDDWYCSWTHYRQAGGKSKNAGVKRLYKSRREDM